MATTSLLPKSIPTFLTNPLPTSSAHSTNASFLPLDLCQPPRVRVNCKKKNSWLDPFDNGDDPDMEYGQLYSDGKQEEDSRPPDNPDNPYGFLKFPMGYSVEVASLGEKISGDLIKDRYPGVQIDVIANERGKQTYEMNKNVRWANVYDVEEDFPDAAEYTYTIGLVKNRYPDMILSTKLAGMGHASFLFMSTARDRVSYVYLNVNAAGAGLFLSQTFTPDHLNLSDGGYNMYHQMNEWLGRPVRNVPRHEVPPLKVSISRKLKEVVAAKYKKLGVEKGKYIVIHGIESDSKASMQSRGDTDSLLPLEAWAQITESIRGFRPIFVIPHEKERVNVEDFVDFVGEDTSMLFITTPGQLAALINDSAGVISTNTAALQLALAREKPSVALFCSEDKAKLFVPNPEDKRCIIVSSKTGKLVDIDIEAVKTAVQNFEMPFALV